MNIQSNQSARPSGLVKTRGLILASLILGLMALPLSVFGQITPTLRALFPSSAQAGSPGFYLDLVPAGFDNTTEVYWDTTLLPVTSVDVSNIVVFVSADMLVTTADITTVRVTVRNGSLESNPLIFTIYGSSVAVLESSVVPSGASKAVQTVYSSPGSGGVVADFTHLGSGDATLTVANYSSLPPLTGPIFDAGGGFYDLKITGASASDLATAFFYYPKNAATDANEGSASFVLQYWAGTVLGWQTVTAGPGGSGLPAPKDTTDNLDGTTLTGGRFTFTFTGTTTPSITALSGTVFTMAPAVPSSQDATGMLLATVNQLAALGTFNAGNARSLSVKLNNAIASMNAGHAIPAAKQLQAFINEVNALVRSRRLSAATGAGLVDAARQIIAAL